jgi:uncharacterized protein (UPF0333 family)
MLTKKSQAAMEFLLTYGWALIVVIVAVGALAYFGVMSPEKFLPEKCLIPTSSGLWCSEFTSSSTANTVTLRIKNILSDSVWVDSITYADFICNFSTADTQIVADGLTDFSLSCVGGLNPGQKLKGSFTILYSVGDTAISGFDKSSIGQLITVVP